MMSEKNLINNDELLKRCLLKYSANLKVYVFYNLEKQLKNKKELFE